MQKLSMILQISEINFAFLYQKMIFGTKKMIY